MEGSDGGEERLQDRGRDGPMCGWNMVDRIVGRRICFILTIARRTFISRRWENILTLLLP